jgi:UDP-GlcNAc:undecaprenyl-phosphate GlcNAc-1-phosphate transferase
VAVLIAYGLALAFILIAPYGHLTISIPDTLMGVRALLPAILLVGLIGILDDIIGLNPWQKLIGEGLAASWVYFGGFGIYGFWAHPLPAWLGLPVTIIWLVGCTNALNMIDGMDGLAAGMAAFASLTTLIAALISRNVQLALVTAPLVGSLLGFLRYNFNPASIFLGDCGSLSIGFLLGCYGAMWSQKSATLLGMTAPLMALAIPLLDATIAIARRYLSDKPVFAADRRHIHHRLLDQGLKPGRAVLVLYAVAGVGAVCSLLMQNQFGNFAVILFCAAAWVGVQHLGYLEFDLARQFLFSGSLRKIIGAHVRIQEFERALARVESPEAARQVIASNCGEFGFSGVRMHVGDREFEHYVGGQMSDNCWQLRIPLRGSQYVNLYRDPQTKMHPVILSEFAEVLGRRLGDLIWRLETRAETSEETAALAARV